MGCINSKKDLSDINPNIYRVVNVDADGVALWSGQLEITPKELTLYRKGKEPTKWSLQHLRRYGFDADLFTFEAGRRCTTGEGIYAFKCRGAESLFHTLQTYIQGIALNDDNTHPMGDFSAGNFLNGPMTQTRNGRQTMYNSRSNNFIGQNQNTNYVLPSSRPTSLSPNGTINYVNSSRSTDTLTTESNYLEPTPMRNNLGTRYASGGRLGSVGSGPLSPEPNSPGSPNSFTIILEVTQLNQQQQQNYQNSNVYQEFPLKSSENNNNLLNRKLSLDIPPQEPAPAIKPVQQPLITSDEACNSPQHQIPSPTDDPSHMYVNVTPGEMEGIVSSGTPTAVTTNQMNFPLPRHCSTYSIDPSTRCYENLGPGEFRPTVTRTRYSKPDIFAKVDLPALSHSAACDKSEPSTPISKQQHNRKVNYIVLDLDQSPSCNSISTTTTTVTTSTAASTGITLTKSLSTGSSITTNINSLNNNAIKTSTPSVIPGANLLPPESPKKSSLGYATIDFNKTVALSNTTAPSLDMDNEGSRKTRHSSSAARQNNSISD